MAKTKGITKEIRPRTTGEEREQVLTATTEEIEKRFGKGAIMRFGDDGPSYEVEAIPTGSIALDAALGIGGVPRGRIIEIYGPESSGKTTLSLEILAEAQARPPVPGYNSLSLEIQDNLHPAFLGQEDPETALRAVDTAAGNALEGE